MKCQVRKDVLIYALEYALEKNDDLINEVLGEIGSNKSVITQGDVIKIQALLNEYGKMHLIERCELDLNNNLGDPNKHKAKVSDKILMYALKHSVGKMTFAPIETMGAIRTNYSSGRLSKEFMMDMCKMVKSLSYWDIGPDKRTWLDFQEYLENTVRKNKQDEIAV